MRDGWKPLPSLPVCRGTSANGTQLERDVGVTLSWCCFPDSVPGSLIALALTLRSGFGVNKGECPGMGKDSAYELVFWVESSPLSSGAELIYLKGSQNCMLFSNLLTRF